MWDMVRRHQRVGRGSRVEIFLWGGMTDEEALVGGVERLGI